MNKKKRLKVYDDYYVNEIFNCEIVNDYWYSGTVDLEYSSKGYHFIKKLRFRSNLYIPFVKDGIPIHLEVCLHE